jgi:hypothetical protein
MLVYCQYLTSADLGFWHWAGMRGWPRRRTMGRRKNTSAVISAMGSLFEVMIRLVDMIEDRGGNADADIYRLATDNGKDRLSLIADIIVGQNKPRKGLAVWRSIQVNHFPGCNSYFGTGGPFEAFSQPTIESLVICSVGSLGFKGSASLSEIYGRALERGLIQCTPVVLASLVVGHLDYLPRYQQCFIAISPMSLGVDRDVIPFVSYDDGDTVKVTVQTHSTSPGYKYNTDDEFLFVLGN